MCLALWSAFSATSGYQIPDTSSIDREAVLSALDSQNSKHNYVLDDPLDTVPHMWSDILQNVTLRLVFL